jgi:hypothetical protein
MDAAPAKSRSSMVHQVPQGDRAARRMGRSGVLLRCAKVRTVGRSVRPVGIDPILDPEQGGLVRDFALEPMKLVAVEDPNQFVKCLMFGFAAIGRKVFSNDALRLPNMLI